MKCATFLIAAAVLLLAGGVSATERLLLERLRVDHAAKVSAEQDFHARRRNGDLDGAEAADYATYIARLHRRVAEDCVAVVEAGLPLPAGLGCPALPLPVLAPAAIDQSTEQTLDEQVAALDARLQRGLGDFDEMLLREQERVRAEAPMTAGTGSGAGSGVGGGGAGQAGTAGGAETATGSAGPDGDPGGNAAAGGPSQRGGPDSGGGLGAGSGTGAQRDRRGTPPGIPDGSDDDVVARQLREAAEKETDPELKKRLWEEYRRYKDGMRRGKP